MSVTKIFLVFSFFFSSAGVLAAEKCFQIYEPLNIVGEENRTNVCKSEIPVLMSKTVDIYPGYEMKYPKYSKDGKIVKNCEMYLSEYGFGGYTMSRNEYTIEDPFIKTCGVLVMLNMSDVANEKIVQKPYDVLEYEYLPPTILPAPTGEAYDEYNSEFNAGKSVSDLVDNGDKSIEYVSLTLLATADVNNDGVEDYIIRRAVSIDRYGLIDFGYLSTTLNHQVASWHKLDHTEVKWPNKSSMDASVKQ